MNKLALALGLSISLSAHAWTPMEPDEVLTITRNGGARELMTFSQLEDEISETNNLLMLWCENKSAIAGSILQDRGIMSRENIVTELTAIKHKMRHYMWVELERITSEVHRFKSDGDFEMAQMPSDVQALTTKEYQKCIINGF